MRTLAPRPGSLIGGKYRVVRVIGSGGMGIVVEATHVTLGQRVAVKIVGGVDENPRALARFMLEARMAAQLPGDHIGRAIDIGRTESGDAFLVMELLVGRDLQAELAQRARLPVGEAVDLILQACEGAAEAHAVGLVHRDIKPANLFLTCRRDGAALVKVLDFGISKWTMDEAGARASLTTAAVGTPTYMAPEQFDEQRSTDARCDQHALAVVLFELISGAPPFAAPTVYALALTISRQPAPSLDARVPAAPAGLAAALSCALAKAPDERFPDLAAFAAAIAPFGGEGAAVSARNVAAILANSREAVACTQTQASTTAMFVPTTRIEPPRLVSERRVEEGVSRSIAGGTEALPRRRARTLPVLGMMAALGLVGAAWLGLHVSGSASRAACQTDALGACRPLDEGAAASAVNASVATSTASASTADASIADGSIGDAAIADGSSGEVSPRALSLPSASSPAATSARPRAAPSRRAPRSPDVTAREVFGAHR